MLAFDCTPAIVVASLVLFQTHLQFSGILVPNDNMDLVSHSMLLDTMKAYWCQ